MARTKWTILVYMNGANDLEEYGSLNINQMETIGSNESVNMVVQFKRIAGRYDTSNGDWSGTRRYYIRQDSDPRRVNSQLLAENTALDMGKKETLQDFVQWGIANFPAERYCLVLWNHGAGWRSQKLPKTTRARGFSYDDVTDSHIDTIQLPEAVDMGGGRRWDLLAFDSSLMQMAEVAYELRNSAQYMTGSEESPPGPGYPYDRIITRLMQNANMDGRELGQHIVAETNAAYTSIAYSTQWNIEPANDITQSLLDMSRVPELAPAVDALGSALRDAKNRFSNEISFARTQAENYAYRENRDLLHYINQLSEVPPGAAGPRVPDGAVQNAAQQVRAVLQAVIIAEQSGTGHPNSNGLAIFLPSPEEYNLTDIAQSDGFGQRYGALAFTRDAPNWQRFLIEGPR